jgi:hypothetical protein
LLTAASQFATSGKHECIAAKTVVFAGLAGYLLFAPRGFLLFNRLP